MEWLKIILIYYHQNKIFFAVVAIIIFVLLIFRFKSFLFRLFLIALLLFGSYLFIVYIGGAASRHKKTLIEKYFPRERLK